MPDNEKPLPPSKVLVVDDNAQNRELLEAYMEDLDGVSTLSATDGEDALAKVAADKPDLILLDVMMPRTSGFEVCKRLKSNPDTKHIPIIMVTALHEMGDIERAVEVGTDDFVTKPVNRIDLLARVTSLLRLRFQGDADNRDVDYRDDLESGADRPASRGDQQS